MSKNKEPSFKTPLSVLTTSKSISVQHELKWITIIDIKTFTTFLSLKKPSFKPSVLLSKGLNRWCWCLVLLCYYILHTIILVKKHKSRCRLQLSLRSFPNDLSVVFSHCRPVGAGMPPPPLFGTLFNPIWSKWVNHAHHITTCPPPDFQTFLRPCKAKRDN